MTRIELNFITLTLLINII